jgi:hypothetical protein
MEQLDTTLTEMDRRFIAAQIAVENLQRQLALQEFDLLRTVSADAVLRPLVLGNFMSAPLLFDWDHSPSR